MFRNTDQRNIT